MVLPLLVHNYSSWGSCILMLHSSRFKSWKLQHHNESEMAIEAHSKPFWGCTGHVEGRESITYGLYLMPLCAQEAWQLIPLCNGRYPLRVVVHDGLQMQEKLNYFYGSWTLAALFFLCHRLQFAIKRHKLFSGIKKAKVPNTQESANLHTSHCGQCNDG